MDAPVSLISVPTPPPPKPVHTQHEAPQIDPILALRQVNQHAQIRLCPKFELSHYPERTSIFAVSNKYGWYIAGHSEGLTFATLEDLRAAFKAAKDVSDDQMSLTPRRLMKLPAHFPTFIKFANNDDHVIVVLENGEICVWKSEQLLKPDPAGEERPLPVFQLPAQGIIADVQPNPGDHPELVAVLYSTFAGAPNPRVQVFNLFTGQVIGGWSGSSIETQPLSICWSTRGKQIAFGTRGGAIIQYSPADPSAPKAMVYGPQGVQGSVIALHWLSNYSFHLVLADPSPPPPNSSSEPYTPTQSHFIHTHDPKAGTAMSIALSNPCDPYGMPRPPSLFSALLKNWGKQKYIMFTGDAPSSEIGIITSLEGKSPAEEWVNILPGEAALNLPLGSDMDETSLMGLEVGLTSTERLKGPNDQAGDEPSLPPAPILYAYTTDGMLEAWWVMDEEGVVFSGMVTPEPKYLDGLSTQAPIAAIQPVQTTTPQVQTPLTPPSENAALPKAAPVSAFAAKPPPIASSGGFAAFASPAKLGASAFSPAPVTTATSSTAMTTPTTPTPASAFSFGAKTATPAFGTTGFGAAAAKTPTFGSTGFGTSPAAPAFGATGFGSTAAPKFGATGFGSTNGSGAASAGFGFGQTGGSASPAPAPGGFNFGQPSSDTPKPAIGFSFGQTSEGGQKPATGFSFGASTSGFGAFGGSSGFGAFSQAAATAQTSEGSATPSSTAFASFGTTKSTETPQSQSGTATPTSTVPSAFGAAAGGFGTTAAAGNPSFGASTGGFSFGTTPTKMSEGFGAFKSTTPSTFGGGFGAFSKTPTTTPIDPSKTAATPTGTDSASQLGPSKLPQPVKSASAFGAPSALGSTAKSVFGSTSFGTPSATTPTSTPTSTPSKGAGFGAFATSTTTSSGGFASFAGGANSQASAFGDMLKQKGAEPDDAKAKPLVSAFATPTSSTSAFATPSAVSSAFATPAGKTFSFGTPSSSTPLAFTPRNMANADDEDEPNTTTPKMSALAENMAEKEPDKVDPSGGGGLFAGMSLTDKGKEKERPKAPLPVAAAEPEPKEGEEGDGAGEEDEEEDEEEEEEEDDDVDGSVIDDVDDFLSEEGLSVPDEEDEEDNPVGTTPSPAEKQPLTKPVKSALSQPGSTSPSKSVSFSSTTPVASPDAKTSTKQAAIPPLPANFLNSLSLARSNSVPSRSSPLAGAPIAPSTLDDDDDDAIGSQIFQIGPPSSAAAAAASLITNPNAPILSPRSLTNKTAVPATTARANTPVAPFSFGAKPTNSTGTSIGLGGGSSATPAAMPTFTGFGKMPTPPLKISPTPLGLTPASPTTSVATHGISPLQQSAFGQATRTQAFGQITPTTTTFGQPLQAKAPQAQMQPTPAAEPTLNSEYEKAIMIMEQELVNIRNVAANFQKASLMLATSRGLARSKHDFSDRTKWTFADMGVFRAIMASLEKDSMQLTDQTLENKKMIAELQSLLLKSETKKEESVRFSRAKEDPDFAKMIKVRNLGPEHIENQARLRKSLQLSNDRVQQLEVHVESLKRKVEQYKSGKGYIRPPSLDTVNRTCRNIDKVITEKTRDVDALTSRLSKLNIEHIRPRRSTQDPSPAPNFKGKGRGGTRTPDVVTATAAALNAERSAVKLKKALVLAGPEARLNSSCLTPVKMTSAVAATPALSGFKTVSLEAMQASQGGSQSSFGFPTGQGLLVSNGPAAHFQPVVSFSAANSGSTAGNYKSHGRGGGRSSFRHNPSVTLRGSASPQTPSPAQQPTSWFNSPSSSQPPSQSLAVVDSERGERGERSERSEKRAKLDFGSLFPPPSILSNIIGGPSQGGSKAQDTVKVEPLIGRRG